MAKVKFKDRVFGPIKLLSYAMRFGDKAMLAPRDSSDGTIVNEVGEDGGVLQDMLQGQVTRQVQEMRDKYYRVLKEADKYDASTIKMEYDEETDQIVFKADGRLKKKTLADFMKRIPVYGENEHKPRVIQDNKMFAKHTQIGSYEKPLGLHDYDTTLTINRDGIIPRIPIEKYVKKMVVRQDDGADMAYIDLYLPTEASQFGKTDAILIANIFRMYEEKNYRSDLTDFESMEWFSDKAWNSPDVCLFKYDGLKLVSIDIFDGSYVLTFTGHIVSDGEYLAKKYETDELTAKYEAHAPKGDTIGMMCSAAKLNNNTDKENKE